MVDLRLTLCYIPKKDKTWDFHQNTLNTEWIQIFCSVLNNTWYAFKDNTNKDVIIDDADVLGYGGVSDDDHLSITSGGSNASDGGVTITTWRHLDIADKQ